MRKLLRRGVVTAILVKTVDWARHGIQEKSTWGQVSHLSMMGRSMLSFGGKLTYHAPRFSMFPKSSRA